MKNNWKEEFRKEFIGEGYTHPGMESFIESLLEEQKKELMEECINIVKGVESYCIQPTGYCNEEKEKEIYLHGFDDMRVFKLIKLLSLRDKLNHHD